MSLVIPNTCRYPLEPYEHVTDMKVMLLRSLETMSGRKEYIVMGTSTVCSEEVGSKGKVSGGGEGEEGEGNHMDISYPCPQALPSVCMYDL